jgi:Ca2+-binding RTX toxin-like protein
MTVIASNDPNGFAYVGADQTVTIAPEVTVSNVNATAVTSAFDYSGLINFGSIVSDVWGLDFGGNHGTIVNAAGASIGGVDGIEAGGDDIRITNDGAILATVADGIYAAGKDCVVVNHGHILGGQSGIAEVSDFTGGVIDNSGLIEGFGSGIRINTAAGVTTEITNTGTIHGQDSSISTQAGSFSLTNEGTLIGDIAANDAGADVDTIVNDGKIKGDVHLGGGADVFIGTGGGSGAVFGGAGSDRIIGGSGADTMDGGAGKDVLTGGKGADHFVFSDVLNPQTNVDRITDFSVPQDTIDLDNAIYIKLGATGNLAAAMFYKGVHAHDANDHISYNSATGALLYDSNGTAAGGEVRFATLAHNLAMTAADFLVI